MYSDNGGISLEGNGDASRRSSALSTGRSGSLPSIPEEPVTFVYISQEREDPNTTPATPKFVGDANIAAKDPDHWHRVVLPFIAALTFVISCHADVHYLFATLQAPNMPHLAGAITKLAQPNFFWFSGVGGNRRTNPYLEVLAFLPSLHELSLTFHTAGLTLARWSERERIRMEPFDMERSKELRVLRAMDVVRKYDLAAVFNLRALRVLRLECYDSAIVRHFTKGGDPLSAFWDLQRYFADGFVQYTGREVRVETKVVQVLPPAAPEA